MQRSEHPSDLAETDPPFLWPGDTVGIALTVVAASRSPVRRTPLTRPVTFRESHALGKPPSCNGEAPLAAPGHAASNRRIDTTGLSDAIGAMITRKYGASRFPEAQRLDER
jgi:hypothetical protein